MATPLITAVLFRSGLTVTSNTMARGQMGENNGTEKMFHFTLPIASASGECLLRLPVRIPTKEPIKEYTHRVMQAFHIPYYVFDGEFGTLEMRHLRV